MKKILLIIAAMLCCGSAAMAVPAYKAKKQIICKDGTILNLTLTGDEHFNYWTDQHGRALRLMQDGDIYVFSKSEMETMRSKAQKAQISNNARRTARRRDVGQVDPLYGKKKGLVILMEYQDVKFSRENANALYSDIFSKAGYSDNGFEGSVSDYFREQSYGQFEIEFDVVGPYTAQRNMSYYGRNTADGSDANARQLIMEGLLAADAEVNFKDYDWNGDGEVEQVYVLYAGYGANFGGNDDAIWPHESQLYQSTPLVMDGVTLDTYACSCELYGSSGTTLDGIGTACHEFSHCLGFPDFYDTAYSGNDGMLTWDVLCSGSYNNQSRTPSGYTSYERYMAGWLTPKEITEETVITDMKALTDAPEAYILYNERNRDEYYLLENRQNQGFDSHIPGHGLLVLHVDYNAAAWAGNSVNVGSPQRMTIIPADGDLSSNAAADPFPGTRGVTELTDVSTPAATLNNRNIGGEKLMHKSIEAIKEKDGLISMIVCAPLLSAPELNSPEWSEDKTVADISWQAVPRANSYELILSGNPRKGSVEDALIIDEDFAGCYSAKVGFTDISSKMNNYTTNKGFSGSKLYQTPELLRIGTSQGAGTLITPVFNSLTTGDLTIVMNVKSMKEDTKVKGSVNIVTNTAETRQTLPLDFSGETTLMLHSTVKFNEIYRVDIAPETGMYIKRLTLYDGNYTENELTKKKAPSRVAQELTAKTSDTHYRFTGLDASYEYSLQIRAMDGDRKSVWSDVFISSSETSIDGVPEEKDTDFPMGVYDLQGRKVAVPIHNGIYIVNGKKVIM